MARRREQRLRTVLPLRVFGMDSQGRPFTDLAHTLDISPKGARIAGLQHSLSVGEIVGVQRGTDKARFRVVWSNTEGQAGLVCIQERQNLWGIEFQESGPDQFDPAAQSQKTNAVPAVDEPRTERRANARFACDLSTEIQESGSTVSMWGRCTDISRGGCYVETRSPMPVGAQVCLNLDNRIRASCTVRSSHPSMGMGVRFEQLGLNDGEHLSELLQQLQTGSPPSTTKEKYAAPLDKLAQVVSELENISLSSVEIEHLRALLEPLMRLIPDSHSAPSGTKLKLVASNPRPG